MNSLMVIKYSCFSLNPCKARLEVLTGNGSTENCYKWNDLCSLGAFFVGHWYSQHVDIIGNTIKQ